jgi:hypothetical protein
MAQQTGTHGIDTLLAARFTSVKEFGEDNIAEILAAELDAHNTLMVQGLAELAEPTTDSQNVYGSAVGGTMTEVDEYGAAPTQRVTPGSTVAYPLKKKQFNLGWTNDYLIEATPADLAIMVQNAQIAHRIEVMKDIKRAVYGAANYTFYDHLVDNQALTVRRLLNADGEPIPAGPNGESYDGSTETHYTAEASLTAANLKASVRNVIEKGHGSMVKMAISLTDETAVRALTGFTAYIDRRHLLSSDNNDPIQQLDVSRVDNRPIGTFDGAEVWVKPWAIANYAFTWDAGSPKKTLRMRQRTNESLQGLRIVSQFDSHPLHAQFMQTDYGFGVYHRSNGAVHYFGGGSYTSPTIS